ncbi:MAG: PKD domain-containing protein, partial [Saprospiraceae bacterium]
NHPLAGFTYFTEELEVTFSGNSYYRPEEWLWDFGDGNGSTERNPIHNYTMPGEYYVCLTVSNEYDSDTFCRWVAVDSVLTASMEVMFKNEVRVFPNPASEEINIALPAPLPAPAEWRMYNTFGQRVHRSVIPAGQREQSLSLAGMPPGLYFWQMRVEGRQIGSGKVVVSK